MDRQECILTGNLNETDDFNDEQNYSVVDLHMTVYYRICINFATIIQQHSWCHFLTLNL
jgi:hypothetical protein